MRNEHAAFVQRCISQPPQGHNSSTQTFWCLVAEKAPARSPVDLIAAPGFCISSPPHNAGAPRGALEGPSLCEGDCLFEVPACQRRFLAENQRGGQPKMEGATLIG